MKDKSLTKSITFNDFKKEILNDYKTIVISRETSLLGRKEVLSGKAKFGIFGDGKELPQIAMAKAFRRGDHRSGYYRDQTFMLALNEISVQQIFSALYANTDLKKNPCQVEDKWALILCPTILMRKEILLTQPKNIILQLTYHQHQDKCQDY